MASWALICKGCGALFVYCEVGTGLEDYYFPAKPDIPADGMVCACPVCKTEFSYRQNEVIFDAGPDKAN